ncbi:DUF2626 family protein [Pasteuria penetrans]|uniref:DUF2626 family protein n=1 Tax=Pasteuria penetrans TaxID=86005 RepID=UPI000FB3C9D6|nr:DUF2626 family protein [Pasteuria penetrans]
MARTFRTLAFWCLAFGLCFLAGDMWLPAALSLGQAAAFMLTGLLHCTERTYMYLFGAYMLLAFVGLSIYANFFSA